MLNRFFTYLSISSNQGNRGNKDNSVVPANQLDNISGLVALLRLSIEGEIPNFILNLPVSWWVMPPVAINKSTQEITVASCLTPRDKKALSQTCKAFYLLYKNEDENQQRNYLNTLFNIKNDKLYNKDDLHKLLSHAALGEWKQAEAIWSNDPSLLTRCGTVYQPNRIYEMGKKPIDIPVWQNPGRYKYVDCTAWQIALMNGEYEEAINMGHFMTEEEKRKQFTEVFPTGKIEKYNNAFNKAKQLLEAVIDAIIDDSTINENNLEKMNKNTRNALQNLYEFVKPALEHKTGLVFDVNIYVEALRLYEAKLYNFLPNKNKDQRSFWTIRIEEYLAALLGTADLRRHAKGVWYNERSERDGCKLCNNSSYFSFHRSSRSLPGLHFSVSSDGRELWGNKPSYFIHLRADSKNFSGFVSRRNQIRDSIIERYSHNTASFLI